MFVVVKVRKIMSATRHFVALRYLYLGGACQKNKTPKKTLRQVHQIERCQFLGGWDHEIAFKIAKGSGIRLPAKFT